MLSIVYVARDDKYGDDYNCVDFGQNDVRNTDPLFYENYEIKYNNVERIHFALTHNLELLEKYFKDAFEIIFVDWSPIKNNYLSNNETLSTILNDKRIRNIIVEPLIIEKEGLNPEKFYEYYGKNIGIRNSIGEYVLVSNPDDLITEELILSMRDAMINDDFNKYYRCYSRLDVDHNLKIIAEGLSFPDNGFIYDCVIGSPASGDFLLAHKSVFFQLTGYHEMQSNGNQAMLDGKLVINMYKQGIKPTMLVGSIMHLDHKKHDRSGGDNNWTNDYKNNSNEWGFNKYTLTHIYKNIYRLISPE